MKRPIFLLFLITFSISVFAQKEATWWYFGNNAGISFTGTGGAPVVQTNGKMNNMEGVASIANSKGGLLFYTDGEFVYTKNHTQMTNGSGLKGHNSSTQSAVIVQQPVRSNRYYIFTVDQEWGANGFEYSIVDTSLNGGLGQVIQKNVVLLSKTAEKVAAVKHANKVDTWVVAHGANDNNFYVYKLNSVGISSTPVVTAVGPVWSTSDKGYSKGYLKFSPDGTKLVAAIAGTQNGSGGIQYTNNNGRIEIYDFDNLTGKLSNPEVIDKTNLPSGVGTLSSVYGLEFSPNGRYLYADFYIPKSGSGSNDGNDKIWQIDMLKTGASAKASSIYTVASGNAWGGMQLGPDGKIYVARPGSTFLSAILKPNCSGSACSFQNSAITLSGKQCQYGIPTFINTFFNKAEFDWASNAADLCEHANTKFFLIDSTGIDSAHWDFGDPASGTNNKAKGFRATHQFSSAKTFSVFVQLYRSVTSPDCYADTARKKITIFANPSVDLGNDTTVCAGQEVVMDATTTNATYIWSDNSTVPVYAANTKGWHWVKLKVGGCTGEDSMYLDVITYPKFSIGNDTLICKNDSIKLTAAGGKRYLWSTGDTTSTTYGKNSGMIWARASNGSCYTYDTMYISHSIPPSLYLGRDTVLCAGQSFTINAKTQDSKKYLWSDNSTDSFLKVNTTGKYWARIQDTLCYSKRDTIQVTFQSQLKLDLGKDTFICKGGSITINAPVTGGKNWKWYDNTTAQSNKITTGGKKYVTVTNGTCTISDTINIGEISLNPFTLGHDTTFCQGYTYDIIPGALTDVEFTWMGTVKNYSYPITKTGKYYVDLRDLPKKVCKSSDTVVVTFKNATLINLGNDTTLCAGQTLDLNVAKYSFKSFKWFDNDPSSIRKNNASTVKHWVTGDDGTCKSSDTINIYYRTKLGFSLGPDVVLCDNAIKNYDVTTAGANQYEWTTGGTSVALSPTYSISNPGGTYIAKVSDGYCPVYDTVTVSYKNTPVFTLGPDIDVCDGNPIDLDASSAAAEAYMWINGGTTPKMNVNAQGQYWVKASNGACEKSDTVKVFFSTPPSIDFGFADSVFCDNPRLSYDFSSPNTTYTWMDGYNLPTRKITVPGLYWVVAKNNCGSDSISMNITIDDNGCRMIFPSAFSPNGDGINDFWKPAGQVISWDELVIYNRWGEVIYKGNPALGWDGKSAYGQEVPDGVYPITISYHQSTNGYPRLFVKSMLLYIIK